ncbi:MAG: hypothetical protein J7M38_06845, partial [Armatimonadetes bacterium]|nr:hypothetical protein [Armatimonadota bacterium]
HYCFCHLGAGEYSLTFIKPDGYSWTIQDSGDDTQDSDVDSTGNITVDSIMLGFCKADLTWDAGLVEQHFTNPGTGTPGYWKTHPEAWPVDTITVGGVTYTRDQAVWIMNNGKKKDRTYTMFDHLVSAKLNVLIGNDDTVIGPYIVQADQWLATYPLGSGVKGSSYAWIIGEPIKDMLDAYNNGELNVPHRD